MRYLILSDIHANLEALEAVLADANPADFDRVILLGDLVGYGADPNAVIDCVKALQPFLMIRGNHDKVACGIEEPEGFNEAARQAARWTYAALGEANRRFLADLPEGPAVVDVALEICHGSPEDEDTYIFEHIDALHALGSTLQPLCFFGHTHVQIGYSLSAQIFDVIVPETRGETSVSLTPGTRYIINPGSVGQPRDGDPRAAYATFDSAKQVVMLYRRPYDVLTAQRKIREAGLPEGLARRLGVGK